jgi:hypothetical protein
MDEATPTRVTHRAVGLAEMVVIGRIPNPAALGTSALGARNVNEASANPGRASQAGAGRGFSIRRNSRA